MVIYNHIVMYYLSVKCQLAELSLEETRANSDTGFVSTL